MASSLQKLIKKRLPITRLIFSSHTQPPPTLHIPSLPLNQESHRIDDKPDRHFHFSDPSLLKNNLTHFNSSIFYPIFPFGFSLVSILSPGSVPSALDDAVSDVGSGMLWADSVKKKRKKKMNKHKYKKLRKRSRRQT